MVKQIVRTSARPVHDEIDSMNNNWTRYWFDELLNGRNIELTKLLVDWWNMFSAKVSSKVCRLSKTNCKYILPSIKPPYRLQLLYALWLVHIKMLDRLKWLIWSQQRKSNKFKSVLRLNKQHIFWILFIPNGRPANAAQNCRRAMLVGLQAL